MIAKFPIYSVFLEIPGKMTFFNVFLAFYLFPAKKKNTFYSYKRNNILFGIKSNKSFQILVNGTRNR